MCFFFFCKQKTAYEMRISDWSSDVCSSDLWDNLYKHLSSDTLQQRAMIDAGLLIENAETGKRYDRFRDRVMFPIRDTRGRIIAFGGRVLGDDKPKYLNSPETPVFHKGQELYGLYEARKDRKSTRLNSSH